MVVYLRDYNGSSYTEIGNGTEFRADWQSGSGSFVQATITITGLNYTIVAGNMLEVKVIVGGSSGDSMWFAYDTTSLYYQPRRSRELDVVPRDVVYSREAGVAPSMPPVGAGDCNTRGTQATR